MTSGIAHDTTRIAHDVTDTTRIARDVTDTPRIAHDVTDTPRIARDVTDTTDNFTDRSFLFVETSDSVNTPRVRVRVVRREEDVPCSRR